LILRRKNINFKQRFFQKTRGKTLGVEGRNFLKKEMGGLERCRLRAGNRDLNKKKKGARQKAPSPKKAVKYEKREGTSASRQGGFNNRYNKKKGELGKGKRHSNLERPKAGVIKHLRKELE